MAKTKNLNLGTHRNTDDVLLPEELPTTYPEGTRPIAPWANLISTEQRVPRTWTEEVVKLNYGGTSDANDSRLDGPPTLDIPSEIAHTTVKLGTQAKKGARENLGGGTGGARKDTEK